MMLPVVHILDLDTVDKSVWLPESPYKGGQR